MASELPASIELAWGLRERPSRGPKRALTLQQIVDAALEVATAEGIGAVSMGRVAREVGVSTMALYRYVERKDDLVELMVDTALGVPPNRPERETWRDGLRRWTRGVRAAYHAHPWAMRVPIKGPPLGPNNVRWLEDALTTLRDTPLSTQQRLSTTLVLGGYARAMEMLESDLASADENATQPQDYAALLRSLVDARDFPEVTHALASGALEDEDDPDFDFEFGLERLLDGVDALMRAQRKRHR